MSVSSIKLHLLMVELKHPSYSSDLSSLEGLISILELGMFLQIDVARAFAIQALSTPSFNLSPTWQLSLALTFHISDWIESVFKELVVTPAHQLSLEDASLLGLTIMHIIHSTQSEICHLCLVLAYNLLKMENMMYPARSLFLAARPAGKLSGGMGLRGTICIQITPAHHLRPLRSLSLQVLWASRQVASFRQWTLSEAMEFSTGNMVYWRRD